MGETQITLKIYGIDAQTATVEALMDTGATFTKIPPDIASQLGLESNYAAEVELGDGRRVTRRLALAEVEIEDVKRPLLVAVGGEAENPSSATLPLRFWALR